MFKSLRQELAKTFCLWVRGRKVPEMCMYFKNHEVKWKRGTLVLFNYSLTDFRSSSWLLKRSFFKYLCEWVIFKGTLHNGIQFGWKGEISISVRLQQNGMYLSNLKWLLLRFALLWKIVTSVLLLFWSFCGLMTDGPGEKGTREQVQGERKSNLEEKKWISREIKVKATRCEHSRVERSTEDATKLTGLGAHWHRGTHMQDDGCCRFHSWTR